MNAISGADSLGQSTLTLPMNMPYFPYERLGTVHILDLNRTNYMYI